MNSNLKSHWERVYETRQSDQLSWTQELPSASLNFIQSFQLQKTAKIIDIGGGESKLVDYLLDQGYENITVLDISEHALQRAKDRLGKRANKVNWLVADITEFNPSTNYDVWHDRATFHFLTTPQQINKYLEAARKSVTGYLAIGTFSSEGPEKCSGLSVKRYNEEQLSRELKNGFSKIRCITEDHETPFHTIQNFLFCSFRRSA